ncbi:MAG: dTMP kinase [Planctomycetota bacterium]
MFFSFDGIDGVGKTTQMQQFCAWLAEQGCDVVTCRDPGSTALGENLREILLASDESTPICALSEMLIYMAARAQLVEEVIRPALTAGKTVVSDRFLLANVVYQGYAGGLDVQQVREVGRIATSGLVPDCTFLLDMAPRAASARMGDSLDRVERRGEDYRVALRQGFLEEVARLGPAFHTIDAERSIDAVQAEIRSIGSSVLS